LSGHAAAAAAAVHSSARRNPVLELAFNPEEIKFRLAAVPVYAVVNTKDEFVLVSGDEDGKQLGLFFFSKEDAEELIATVRRSW
jgi:hypothetical protein